MGFDQAVTTQAYVVDHVGGPFELKDIILDKTRDNEVLVELLYTGLCHTVPHIPLMLLSCGR